ncbi:MAG TPA: hypothetical protein VFH38_07285 [Jatrophihabitans sp.]|nr:hypothetical protein [Jatrophihabitans sp.]
MAAPSTPQEPLTPMAAIHDTTMSPTKLELLTTWLPTRPWYRDTGTPAQLAKVGGFRLDDPDGEVGIEFMVVADRSAPRTAIYHVPMTYRAGPLTGADDALIGTSEHGVLGRRWIYDGTRDPVFVAQLLALLHGAATPQAQSRSDTPDPSVHVVPVPGNPGTVTGSSASDDPTATELRVSVATPAQESVGALVVRVVRQPVDDGSDSAGSDQGCVRAPWRTGDGTASRGVLVTALRIGEPLSTAS